MTTTPRSFSHIGLSVPDLERAVEFYTEVLGLYMIMEPTEVVEDDSPIGVMCTDVFGAGWGGLRIAHFATADRVGIEILVPRQLRTREQSRAPAPRYVPLLRPGPRRRGPG